MYVLVRVSGHEAVRRFHGRHGYCNNCEVIVTSSVAGRVPVGV